MLVGWGACQSRLYDDLQVRGNAAERKCLYSDSVDVSACPSELAWCAVRSLGVVGAQTDCARADRVPSRLLLGLVYWGSNPSERVRNWNLTLLLFWKARCAGVSGTLQCLLSMTPFISMHLGGS